MGPPRRCDRKTCTKNVFLYSMSSNVRFSRPRGDSVSSSTDQAFEQAMRLPEDDRVALIGRLLETMPTRAITLSLLAPDLREELDRRFADRDGEIPWGDLQAES
ncbi:MAG: hypothetical protein EBS83_11790 [Planctomycetia bacterium]|nr:hypothetical protein [Planctomycetia bacterium]